MAGKNGSPQPPLVGLPGGASKDLDIPETLKERVGIYLDALTKKAEKLSNSMRLATGDPDVYHAMTMVVTREVALLRCDVDDLIDKLEQVVENQEALVNIASSAEDS